jgi:surface antigen
MKKLFIGLGLLTGVAIALFVAKEFRHPNEIGDRVDSLNSVVVYYNGSVDHVLGRNIADDGYNLGLKYQCVEFVKRYYYEHLNHKMPDSYGHAKDFFDRDVKDGEWNKKRALVQYTNPSKSMPRVSDLIIFNPTDSNPYGHVAIVSRVQNHGIEIIQQNPGPYASSRVTIPLDYHDGKWRIGNGRVAGWLRKQSAENKPFRE